MDLNSTQNLNLDPTSWPRVGPQLSCRFDERAEYVIQWSQTHENYRTARISEILASLLGFEMGSSTGNMSAHSGYGTLNFIHKAMFFTTLGSGHLVFGSKLKNVCPLSNRQSVSILLYKNVPFCFCSKVFDDWARRTDNSFFVTRV